MITSSVSFIDTVLVSLFTEQDWKFSCIYRSPHCCFQYLQTDYRHHLSLSLSLHLSFKTDRTGIENLQLIAVTEEAPSK